MLKKIEGLHVPEINIVPAQESASGLLTILFCTIAFVLCILFTAAPLSRIPDPVIHLQTPSGSLLAQAGSWLPPNLGLAAKQRATLADTGYVEFLALFALAFAIYGLCALFILRQAAESIYHRQTRGLIRLGAAVAGLIYVFTPAMLSHDILAYASYSRLLAVYHANPYFVPISHFLHDPFTPLNYWAHTTSAYGPIWMFVCALLGFVLGPQPIDYVLAFRLFALAAHLLNIWLVIKTLQTMAQSSRTVTLGALLYAWNPLVLLESNLGGHNDIFMLTFLLLGIFLCARAEKQGVLTHPRGYLPPVVAFSLAALVKYTMLPVIVLFIIFLALKTLQSTSLARGTGTTFKEAISLRWKPAFLTALVAGMTTAVITIAFYGPFWIGHSIKAIENSFTSLPSSLYAQNSILRAINVWTRSHSLYLSTHPFRNKAIQFLGARPTWDHISIATLGITIILGAIWLWYAPSIRTFILASLATLGALLIVTPWFYSWYIIWLVGLAAVCLPLSQDRIGRALLAFTLIFSASALLTYLFKDGYPPFGTWTGLDWLTTILPPLLAFLIAFVTWRPTKHPVKQAA